MTPEEYKTMVDNLGGKITELKAEIEKRPSAEKMAEVMEQLKQFTEIKTVMEEQKEQITTIGTELEKLKKGGEPKGFKTINQAIAYAVISQKADFDAILAKGGKMEGPLRIEIKAAVDMGEGNTIGAGTTQVQLTQNTGKVSVIRSRELRYMAAVSVGTIGTERALWTEETDEQGTPIFIGEGDSKTQLSVLYVEKTESVKKIAVYGKITTELMADLPQLVSYIQNNLMRRLDIVIENKLISATGAGDDIKGMKHFATAFAPTATLALAVVDANELDVIEAIADKVKSVFGIPSNLFINPSTMSKIKLIKDLNGRPVWKDYVTPNGMFNISGMDIIESNGITAGEFLGGETEVANVLIRESLAIQIGRDGNDFIQNKKTMLVEKRLVQYVMANDTQVIVKGDFASAIALIKAP